MDRPPSHAQSNNRLDIHMQCATKTWLWHLSGLFRISVAPLFPYYVCEYECAERVQCRSDVCVMRSARDAFLYAATTATLDNSIAHWQMMRIFGTIIRIFRLVLFTALAVECST